MRPAEQLSQFVAEALAAGRSRAEIAAALRAAGWTETETAEALGAWAEGDFLPPVPRPRPYLSAREAFVYGLMFLALAMTTWHVTALGFRLIDRWIPSLTDPATYSSADAIRWSIASLVVFFPLFLILNERTARAARRNQGLRRSAARRWFGHLTLFLATLALLGDLIAVIYAALGGDLTLRFLAKAGLVAVTAGIVLAYFRGEMAEPDDAA
ncbi:DUF5671 domain-containing protein [Rhodovulum steppense]|uniref:DUF5671 domain-containing protein n=1 Tax=Rhodovulum steppense TaxID=540251 RepID=A0A4R1YUS3_9RHOB|nr:DUF5671 domain-containing protein [Rhodovulum steppense]TCM84617.1 hypothetical protein EV216_11199 [Rhodovulum steppense]